MANARKNLKKVILTKLDSSPYTIFDEQDLPFEDTDEFVSFDLLNMPNEAGLTNYQGFFQLTCVSKKRNIYSLDEMVDAIRDLFLNTYLCPTGYSTIIYQVGENLITAGQIALTFNFKTVDMGV